MLLPKKNPVLDALAAPKLFALSLFNEFTCQLWHHWDEMLRRLHLPRSWAEPLWVLNGIASFRLTRYLWPDWKIHRKGGEVFEVCFTDEELESLAAIEPKAPETAFVEDDGL